MMRIRYINIERRGMERRGMEREKRKGEREEEWRERERLPGQTNTNRIIIIIINNT